MIDILTLNIIGFFIGADLSMSFFILGWLIGGLKC